MFQLEKYPRLEIEHSAIAKLYINHIQLNGTFNRCMYVYADHLHCIYNYPVPTLHFLSPIVHRQLALMLHIPGLCKVPVVYIKETNCVHLRYLFPMVLQASLNSYTLFIPYIVRARTPKL